MRRLHSEKVGVERSVHIIIPKKEQKKMDDAYSRDAAKWVVLARKAYTMSALHCPEMLRWKVWVAGARSEISCGNVQIAGQLLERAMKCVRLSFFFFLFFFLSSLYYQYLLLLFLFIVYYTYVE